MKENIKINKSERIILSEIGQISSYHMKTKIEQKTLKSIQIKAAFKH